MEKIMKSTKLLHKILGILFWVVVVVSIVLAVVVMCNVAFIDDEAVVKRPLMII